MQIFVLNNDWCLSVVFASTGSNGSVIMLLNDVVSSAEPEVHAHGENSHMSSATDMPTVRPLQASVFYSSRKQEHKKSCQLIPSRPEVKSKSRKPSGSVVSLNDVVLTESCQLIPSRPHR